MNVLVGIVLIVVGTYALLGGVCAWKWFMSTAKAEALAGWIGRTGARIFYAVAGAIFLVLGILAATGAIPPPP